MAELTREQIEQLRAFMHADSFTKESADALCDMALAALPSAQESVAAICHTTGPKMPIASLEWWDHLAPEDHERYRVEPLFTASPPPEAMLKELREAAQAVLDTRNAEARAESALETAGTNYSANHLEMAAWEEAMLVASTAERNLAALLSAKT